MSSVSGSNCSLPPLLLASLRSMNRAVSVAPTMAPPIAVMMIQTHQKVWPGPRLGLSSVAFSMLSAGMIVSNADEDGANDDGADEAAKEEGRRHKAFG